MKIKEIRTYRGPNYYSLYDTVIRWTIDLEQLEQYPSDRLGDFVDKLIAAMPSLWEHRCSEGEEGGFVNRLYRGTWMGHILEHIAIELQSLAGTPVGFGKTRGAGQPGVYHMVYEYQEEKVGHAAGELSVKLVRSLLPPELDDALPEKERRAFVFKDELEELIELASELALGPSTRSLVIAAEKRGIPWIRLDEGSLVQLGYGKHQKRIQATITSNTSQIATEIAGDKQLTNQLLRDSGLPVPSQVVVRAEEQAVEAAKRLGYPVVTKPLDLNQGRGASLNLFTEGMVRHGFRHARAEGGLPVIVESYLEGKDYRVLIINGKIVAVSERVPGHIIGDGVHTIRELVDQVNLDPRRGLGHEKVLTRIYLDEQAQFLMNQAGVTPDTVLPEDEIFFLRATANLSTGGTAIDRTDEIHPVNADIALRAARIIGLDVAGIDLIMPDISKPITEVGGGIVEVNAAPGFRMHVSPSEGKPRDVAGPVIDMLFPPGTPSRIPIAAITGTNGKTTTTAMVGQILKNAGYCVGMTTTNGILIDGEWYLRGDMTGPWSARAVLRDPRVEAAVLETARGGILREGAGFDRCDVGAILNVTGDHLGIGGIDTLEQLAKLKALVIELVDKDGYAVLNADDPLVASLAELSPGKPVYFTMSDKNRLVREHISQGGRAVVLEKGIHGAMLTLYEGDRHIPVLWANQIPATLGGSAKFNMANALAATAIAYSLGISVKHIREGLQSFATTFQDMPGRLNVYDERGYRVIIDYAHNPAAMRAMVEMLRAMRRPRKIGVIAAPGDRRDEDILELGRIAGGIFDELIIKEEVDLRGRPSGVVINLLRDGALQGGISDENITLVLDEYEAVDLALEMAKPGELVAIFADDLDGVWARVTSCPACEEAKVHEEL